MVVLRPCNARLTTCAARGANPARHHCHWPGCIREVPPAMWGCKPHWFALPEAQRARLWRAYRQGQEIDGRPSREYLEVAREIQAWIVAGGRVQFRPPATCREQGGAVNLLGDCEMCGAPKGEQCR